MRRRSNQKKEKFIMLASSLFVLSALTLTGFYVKERNKVEKENSVDFSKLENSAADKSNEIANNFDTDESADLAVQEANTSKAINPQYPSNASNKQNRYQYSGVPIIKDQVNAEEEDDLNDLGLIDQETVKQETVKQETAANVRTLTFSEEEGLTWPIVGNVLINYSMDKTVFFQTLQQYKYSPAIVIAATKGERIASASDGKVIEVFNDAQLGNCVKVDLGDGYELTYGQLTDICVKKGDYVDVGDMIGSVAAPTKYYSVEGCNVYFKLTKDQEPISPLNRLS